MKISTSAFRPELMNSAKPRQAFSAAQDTVQFGARQKNTEAGPSLLSRIPFLGMALFSLGLITTTPAFSQTAETAEQEQTSWAAPQKLEQAKVLVQKLSEGTFASGSQTLKTEFDTIMNELRQSPPAFTDATPGQVVVGMIEPYFHLSSKVQVFIAEDKSRSLSDRMTDMADVAKLSHQAFSKIQHPLIAKANTLENLDLREGFRASEIEKMADFMMAGDQDRTKITEMYQAALDTLEGIEEMYTLMGDAEDPMTITLGGAKGVILSVLGRQEEGLAVVQNQMARLNQKPEGEWSVEEIGAAIQVQEGFSVLKQAIMEGQESKDFSELALIQQKKVSLLEDRLQPLFKGKENTSEYMSQFLIPAIMTYQRAGLFYQEQGNTEKTQQYAEKIQMLSAQYESLKIAIMLQQLMGGGQ